MSVRPLTVVSSAPRGSGRRADPTSPSPVGAALHHPNVTARDLPGVLELADLVRGSGSAPLAPDQPRPPDQPGGPPTVPAGLARLWGAEQAHVVPEATPTAVQALLLARAGAIDEVLVARDVPATMHAALIGTGASPLWVTPRVDGRSGLSTGIDPEDVASALERHPRVRVLLMASPSYAGIRTDLAGLRSVTRRHGVALVLDQSRGSHLHWHPHLGTRGPADADAVITPADQVLPESRGWSLLLLHGDAFDAVQVQRYLRGVDPAAPRIADGAEPGDRRLTDQLTTQVMRTVEMARLARSMLARVPGVHVLSAADLALPVDRIDPCTIVLEVNGRGVNGTRAEQLMRENHDVRVDGADTRYVHLVIGPDDDLGTVRRLVIAVASLGSWTGPARRHGPDPLALLPEHGPQVITPRAAWHSPTEPARVERCVGRICADLVTAYPPGIAVVAPGEALSVGTVAWLLEAVACGRHLRGGADPTLATLRVVAAQ